jgi:hypothetical protein
MPPGTRDGWQSYPRTVDGCWRAIDDLREAIDAMVRDGEIQKAVAAALREHDREQQKTQAAAFTRRERMLGLGIATLAMIPGLIGIILRLKGVGA